MIPRLALCAIARSSFSKRTAIEAFPWGMFVGPDAPFSYLAGSYDRGLIFVIADEEKFGRFKEKFPRYKNLDFGPNSNGRILAISTTSILPAHSSLTNR